MNRNKKYCRSIIKKILKEEKEQTSKKINRALSQACRKGV